MNWYAVERFSDDPNQMAAYSVLLRAAPANIEIYREELQQKVGVELEQCQSDTTEIYDLLSSSFELENWFSTDQIATNIVERMINRLVDEPVAFIEVTDVEVISMAQSQKENPDILFYQAVSDYE